MSEPLEIVILGGGTAGWMAAITLVSYLPATRCRVRLIESEEIGIVGVGEATLPQLKSFNNSIRVDEAEMMRATKGAFKLGIEFVGWGSEDSSYIHPFGMHGPADKSHIFHHQWVRALRKGWISDIQDYSYGVQAAYQRRFDFPDSDSSKIESTYSYAYHFDASLYSVFLRRLAEERGATRTEGMVREVVQDPESGDVRSLVLESGETVSGDLFIDCSGFRSLLLDKTLGVGWDDWSQWLPCDRAYAVPSERGDFTPFTRSTAVEAGWRWRIPLQHRTGNGYVFSTSFISEDEAAQSLLRGIDGAALADPRLLKFRAGRRVVSWEKNCVAVGLASGFLEPLESTSIYLIQTAILQLLPLLPARRIDPRLRDEFNHLIDMEYERIRDFLILHYKVNDRQDAEIWRYCAAMNVPDSLREKIELFRHCGIIERYHGLFSPPSWLAVFVGQGLVPEGYNPLADHMPIDEVVPYLDGMRTDIREKVAKMPTHGEIIDRYCAIGNPVAFVPEGVGR